MYLLFIYFYFHCNSYSSYSVKLLKICTLIIFIPNFLYISVIVDLIIIVMMDIKHSSLSNIKHNGIIILIAQSNSYL